MNTFFEEKSSQNVCRFKKNHYLCIAFERDANMVAVVQLVRASDCGSECRGFESHLPPAKKRKFERIFLFFVIVQTIPLKGRQRGINVKKGQRNNLRYFIFKHII